MNFIQYLTAAGVPIQYHAEAIASLEGARSRAKGLTWAKWRVRLFRARKIASLLPWHAERLLDVRPDLAAWDIAPMVNITAHGDNVPWPQGRPAPGAWLNPDPTSAEYKEAVAANYWHEGTHPRSAESRAAWYRRNAGEYEAWARGMPVDLSAGVQVWRGQGTAVYRCGQAWQIVTVERLVGKLHQRVRVGYEVSNVWHEATGQQAWYPIPGHELRAPVTWSVLPAWGAPDA